MTEDRRWRTCIKSDAFRYSGLRDLGWRTLRAVWIYSPGFRFSFWFRLAQAVRAGGRDKRRGWKRIAFWLAHRMMNHYRHRFGFDIPVSTSIGAGLKFGHFGGVVVNEGVTLGENAVISHGVTLGRVTVGPRKGCPTIGDRVWLGPGCCVIGRIKVGNDVLIGPNATVFFDVPDNAIVVGNPGRIASADPARGSRGYNFRRWEG